jgi:DNA-binding transcriptional LysR family regulator
LAGSHTAPAEELGLVRPGAAEACHFTHSPCRHFLAAANHRIVSRRTNRRRCPVVEQEVEDVVTCIALVASRFGVCVTTESAVNLRLPGVVYRPLKSARLRQIELSCLYRRDDASPILQAFLHLIQSSRSRRVRVKA